MQQYTQEDIDQMIAEGAKDRKAWEARRQREKIVSFAVLTIVVLILGISLFR